MKRVSLFLKKLIN